MSERTPLEMARHIIEMENSYDKFPHEAVVVAREVIKAYEKLEDIQKKMSEGTLYFVPNGFTVTTTGLNSLNIIKINTGDT